MSGRPIMRGCSAIVMVVVAMAASSAAGAARHTPADVDVSGFYADSEPGDPIGGGRTEWTGSTGVSVVIDDLSGFEAQAFGPEPSEFWELFVNAPQGMSFTPGTTYPLGPTRTTTQATLRIDHLHGSGGSCRVSDGQLTIRELTRGLGPTKVAFGFKATCGAGASLFGEFRSFSTVGVRALTVSPTDLGLGSVPVGHVSSPQVITLAAVDGLPVEVTGLSLAGPGAADFAIGSEDCTAGPVAAGGQCTIELTARPSMGGSRTARLRIDDDTARGERDIPLAAVGTLPSSGVGWGPIRSVTDGFTWTGTEALARTSRQGAAWLQAVSVTDHIGGQRATNQGPWVSVEWSRSRDRGATWSTPRRINPVARHGTDAAIASAGTDVVVVWVQVAHWPPRTTEPRVLFMRRAGNAGAGSWTAPLRLSSATGRADRPAIAAVGRSVFVTWTDGATGSVFLTVSRDGGATWSRQRVGTTTAVTGSDRSGLPDVAANASVIVVGWRADPDGAVMARTSFDGGEVWSEPLTFAERSRAGPSVAVGGSRAAVAWAGADHLSVVVRTADGWGEVRPIGAPYGTGRDYVFHDTPAVALGPGDRVGVAWSACWSSCESLSARKRSDLVWAESDDLAVHWFRTQVVVESTAAAVRHLADRPSMVWTGAGDRLVLLNAGQLRSDAARRLFLRVGTGP